MPGPQRAGGIIWWHNATQANLQNLFVSCALQVSPDSGLLQCSTVADLVDFKFADGEVGQVPHVNCTQPGKGCASISLLQCT